jgi:hypothetical protein
MGAVAALGRVHRAGLTALRSLAAGLTDRRLRLFAVAFVVGQVCDSVTTHAALASGRFSEANPLFAPALMAHPGLAMVLKLMLAFSVLLLALTKLGGTRRQMVLLVLAFISLEAPTSNALHILGVL